MRPVLGWAAFMLLGSVAARAQCSVTATPVSFGTYLPFSAMPTDSTGGVAVACRGFRGPYTIALNTGLSGSGSFANRRMRRSNFFLPYQLYTNAARNLVWGDGTSGTAAVSGTCLGVCSNLDTVYGRIQARQVARPGAYADTIVVTVTF
jgi:spore coat protein U-like protein